ncbi:hypothetical protein Tco_0370620 [Tanacetum coccineum]
MFVHGYTDDEYENFIHPDADNVTLTGKLDSCAMILALEGRNKTGFIDNTCRRSNTDEVLDLWSLVQVLEPLRGLGLLCLTPVSLTEEILKGPKPLVIPLDLIMCPDLTIMGIKGLLVVLP